MHSFHYLTTIAHSAVGNKNSWQQAPPKRAFPFLLPYEKNISENQWMRLLEKGSTVQLKGFQLNSAKVSGRICLNESFELVFEPKEESSKEKELQCPKCKKGIVVKGKTAFGCNAYQEGCDFKLTFEQIREQAVGKALSKKLVRELIVKSAKQNITHKN